MPGLGWGGTGGGGSRLVLCVCVCVRACVRARARAYMLLFLFLLEFSMRVERRSVSSSCAHLSRATLLTSLSCPPTATFHPSSSDGAFGDASPLEKKSRREREKNCMHMNMLAVYRKERKMACH